MLSIHRKTEEHVRNVKAGRLLDPKLTILLMDDTLIYDAFASVEDALASAKRLKNAAQKRVDELVDELFEAQEELQEMSYTPKVTL